MKIVTEPTVLTFSTAQFNEDITAFYPLPSDGDSATRIGAFSAKVCYRSFGEDGRSCEDNQRAIIESRHGRILEHINYGLFITGISRALGNELITHKAGITVSQESTRYVSMEDAGIVLEPHMAELFRRSQHGNISLNEREILLLAKHIESLADSLEAYDEQYRMLVDQALNSDFPSETAKRKWARGKARNVLPLALETSMVVTGNLRAWRHFIEMRSSRYAEAEIRRLTYEIFKTLSFHAPLYFSDYKAEYFDGFLEYTTPNIKV